MRQVTHIIIEVGLLDFQSKETQFGFNIPTDLHLFFFNETTYTYYY
jgi:hypothetical protein